MGSRLRRSRSRKLRRDETVSDRRVCGLLIGNRWAAGAPALWVVGFVRDGACCVRSSVSTF